MADINKPDLTNLWASDGAVIPPSPSKIQTGWVAEIPPHQWENYVQNRQDVALAYLLQKGVPEWDNTTEYIANKSVVTYDGNIYFAIQTSTNNNPSSSPSHWIPLEEKFADSLGLGTAATRDVGTGANEVPANSNLGAAAYLPIATTSQAQELTNDATVITPKKLGDAMSAHVLGMGQTWQNVTSQRASGVTYTNTTGRAIVVLATTHKQGGLTRVQINVDGEEFALSSGGDPTPSSSQTNYYASTFAIVPPGSTYAIFVSGVSDTLRRVWELR